MVKENPTLAFIPEDKDLESLKAAAKRCEGCELYKFATVTVFGEGPPKAKVVFVGEQPGDVEDREGKPFVGPAGKLFNRVLDELEIPRDHCYVTNVVKHFKFEWRGKRRLHKTPRPIEISSCLPWLELELKAIKPELTVLLGATAAQALLGKSFRVTRERGVLMPGPFGGQVMATVHPSSILRAIDDETRDAELASFTNDLKAIKKFVE